MTRRWYVSPVRVRPGFYIPGRYDSSDGYWMGPSPSNEDCKGEMEKVRGPFASAKDAAEAARVWREDEGKHSDIWLCLVEGDYNEVTHCNKYDPEGYVQGKRVEVRRARATGGGSGTGDGTAGVRTAGRHVQSDRGRDGGERQPLQNRAT